MSMDDKRHKEDIIEIKPGIYGVSVNIRALWRRWTEKPKIDPVGIVAQRFIQIFRDHGVSPAQIPRFIPEITLEKLVDSNSLLSALTPGVLDKTAELFQIRREWLDGMGGKIYKGNWCYKHPEVFFDDIAKLNMDATLWPVIAFCKDDKLNYRKNREQPLVLATVERIATIGDREIDRYHIYGDGWIWNYFKCRIQIKAMLRVLHELHGTVVPLFPVGAKLLKEIEAGWRVPRHFYMRRSRRAFLEDFSMSSGESHVAKETEELPLVERYIRAYNLRRHVGLPQEKSQDPPGVEPPTLYEFT